jgi:hypothetical protein
VATIERGWAKLIGVNRVFDLRNILEQLHNELCKLARVERPEEVGRNGPQVLIYPALDATLSTAAMRAATVKRRAEC